MLFKLACLECPKVLDSDKVNWVNKESFLYVEKEKNWSEIENYKRLSYFNVQRFIFFNLYGKWQYENFLGGDCLFLELSCLECGKKIQDINKSIHNQDGCFCDLECSEKFIINKVQKVNGNGFHDYPKHKFIVLPCGRGESKGR